MTTLEVLNAVKSGELSAEDAQSLLAKPLQPLRCKVGEKGGVSVYGLNRQFPVTLYVEQWERLFSFVPEIQGFIKQQNGSLKRKG